MVWYLGPLKRLNGIQWSWVQMLLRPTFYSYFKESISAEYHMYQLISLHSCDYLQKTSIKINVATDEGKQPKWNVTLNKRWNWSSCTKLALSASWTHGLISQSESVRASERNSLVASSNRLRPTFYSYFKESIKGEYNISKLFPLHSCDYLQKTSIKTNVATDEGKRAKIKCDTEQMMKLQ